MIAETIVGEVIDAAMRWPDFAGQARVSDLWTAQIAKTHRLSFPKEEN